jgi:hypothetical protein
VALAPGTRLGLYEISSLIGIVWNWDEELSASFRSIERESFDLQGAPG